MKLATKRSSLFNRPLYLAAILLTASVVLRIVVQADQAVALVQTKEDPLPATTTVQSNTCEDTFDVEPVLTALNNRSARLDEKEEKLLELANTAEQAKIDAEARLAALEQAETRLKELVSVAQTAAQSDLAKLTAVYAAMNAKQAAALFEEMDPDFAAGFLGLLEPEKAAEILAGVSPSKAYALSVIVAGRNANAPTE